MAEVEEALGKGEKNEDLEAKFRELERGGSGGGKSTTATSWQVERHRRRAGRV